MSKQNETIIFVLVISAIKSLQGINVKAMMKFLAVFSVLVALAGCGGGGPKVYKAGGIVTYKGSPVSGAQVAVAYEGSDDTALGVTGADGKFELNYLNKVGAKLGKGSVAITKLKMPPPDEKMIRSGDPATGKVTVPVMDSEEMKRKMGGASGVQTPPPAPTNELPAKYADAKTSGITVEITTTPSKNNYTFDLKD